MGVVTAAEEFAFMYHVCVCVCAREVFQLCRARAPSEHYSFILLHIGNLLTERTHTHIHTHTHRGPTLIRNKDTVTVHGGKPYYYIICTHARTSASAVHTQQPRREPPGKIIVFFFRPPCTHNTCTISPIYTYI
jgi:hypothetical protein